MPLFNTKDNAGSKPNWLTTAEKARTYGVDPTELGIATAGDITGLTILTTGSGYASAPTVTLGGATGSGATATATIDANGKIDAVAVTAGGANNYTVPTMVFAAPAALTIDLTADLVAGVFTLSHPYVDGDVVALVDGSGDPDTKLANGTYYVVASVADTSFKLAATLSGTAIVSDDDGTSTNSTLTGQTATGTATLAAEGSGGTGWVQHTVNTKGESRETLVSFSGDRPTVSSFNPELGVDATNKRISFIAGTKHTLVNGNLVTYAAGGSAVGTISNGDYWVVGKLHDGSIQLSATEGGAARSVTAGSTTGTNATLTRKPAVADAEDIIYPDA